MSFSHTEAWLNMLNHVAETGDRVMPRGLPSRQHTFTEHTVVDPLTFPLAVEGREFRDAIGVLEGLSLVGEFSVPELFTNRVKKFADFMDGGIMWGAYGARTHGQLGGIADLLERDQDSRQAVMTFYDAKRDLNSGKKDIPCTISGQFFVNSGEVLDLGISMRSNDLWLGTPYDLVQFSILQASLAQALNVKVGRYVHRVGSLHLYDRDLSSAKTVSWKGGPPMPFPLWDIGHVEGSERRMAAIQRSARLLALGMLVPQTAFEKWAWETLYNR